jgi:hypothetical protein
MGNPFKTGYRASFQCVSNALSVPAPELVPGRPGGEATIIPELTLETSSIIDFGAPRLDVELPVDIYIRMNRVTPVKSSQN